MSFSDAELVALVGAGVTAAQLVAAIIAGREDARARRAARKAAKMNEADSIVVRDALDARHPDSGRVRVAVPSPGQVAVVASEISVGGPVKDRARRAAMLTTALRPGARRVLGQLIEHHNLRTGRCDPSVGRMAGLVGLSARSVRRAIAQLEAAGLVARLIHGGQRHANAYRLDFDAMARLGLVGGTRQVVPAKMNDADSGTVTRTRESADPDSRVRQNLPRNLKPSEHQEKPVRARPNQPAGARQKDRAPDRRQGWLPLPIPGGADRASVADGQAEKRVWQAMQGRWGRSETALALVLGLDAAVFEGAHAAERDRPGAGIGVIERALKVAGSG